jgi:hypothetical protein
MLPDLGHLVKRATGGSKENDHNAEVLEYIM